jgi:hypothetical protein
MKIAFLSLSMLFLFICAGFSAGKAEIQLHLEEKTFLNPGGPEVIATMAGDISFEEKMLFYSMYKKEDAAIGFVLNFLIPGLGIGNYVIGDTSGGTITLVGSILSWAVYAVGLNMIYSTGYTGLLIGYAGIGGVCFFSIRGLVSPFTYVDHYNKQLKKALMMGNLSLDDGFHMDLFSISF